MEEKGRVTQAGTPTAGWRDTHIWCAPRDAYEFSFVAVPAQPGAGVLKGLGCGEGGLRELVKGCAGASAELEELER